MTRLYIILLLFPFTLCAKVWCSMYALNDSAYTIVCQDDGESTGPSEQPEFNKPILSKSDCEDLREQVVGVLSNALTVVVNTQSNMTSLVLQDWLGADLGQFQDYLDQNRAALVSAGVYDDLYGFYENLSDDRGEIYTLYNSYINDLESMNQSFESNLSNARSIQCPENQQCSSSGSGTPASCPCQSEFNEVLQKLSSANSLLHSISNDLLFVRVRAQEISLHVSNAVHVVSNIINRLNIPDDRIWSEIGDIYYNYVTNRNMISYQALELRNIFYGIEQLLRGDGSTNLNLSTEGVIALNQLLFDMSNFRLGQQGLDSFQQSVRYFSNTVTRLFEDYKWMISGNASTIVPTDGQYNSSIMRAMTNIHLSARQRYLALASRLAGGPTNWFQRMELYQQAQLGWFDGVLPESQLESDQKEIVSESSDSSVRNSLEQTTNHLSSITMSASNLVQAVGSSFDGVIFRFVLCRDYRFFADSYSAIPGF